ncbi:hypothetical protein [Comamonas jiangduensis]|uniref:hypothetical protein n=1 Tax=Comamonas jiangduensis TaxID=1194168 RepID=UPI001583DD83|nr:hypothetical protein [Comamonas jiangduensis]
MIICNTLSGAVSEYSGHDFQSIIPTHGGSSDGLFAFGGDTDAGEPIVAEIRLPATLRQSTLKQQIQMVYLSMRGQGEAEFSVLGPGAQAWSYRFALRDSEQTRCPVGKGIRENYMGFALRTPEGQAFTLDRIEVMTAASKTRRV